MNEPVLLSEILPCFYGVIPSALATADRNGVPNVAFISQVHYLDEGHVAISRQFFNKTSRNLDDTRKAFVEIYDPVSLQAYRLRLRFLRSETSGELFETMSARIEAIASHTGMKGVFRLIASDVFEVDRAVRVEGFLTEVPVVSRDEELCGDRSELRGLQLVSDRINRSGDLEQLFDEVLESLDSAFGFCHTMLLIHDGADRLVTSASRGYGESGIGAEVRIGEGFIGMAARERQALRVTAVEEGLRYGRAARREHESAGSAPAAEIPLPGLPNPQAALVIPLWVGDALVGALFAESENPVAFGDWHEAYLELIGNQVALGISRMMSDVEQDDGASPLTIRAAGRPQSLRHFIFYRADESVFLDDDYLIRNVPARILWKLLSEWKETGRVEFTNRELRLDKSLGLPEIKDNLESRLILLRRRLDEKCGDVRIVRTGRGRFSLVVDAEVVLQER